jgi:hypothetical protein
MAGSYAVLGKIDGAEAAMAKLILYGEPPGQKVAGTDGDKVGRMDIVVAGDFYSVEVILRFIGRGRCGIASREAFLAGWAFLPVGFYFFMTGRAVSTGIDWGFTCRAFSPAFLQWLIAVDARRHTHLQEVIS